MRSGTDTDCGKPIEHWARAPDRDSAASTGLVALTGGDGATRRPPEAGGYATLRLVRRYAASPSSAIGAWLDAALARRWLFATASQALAAVSIDARIGGCFHLVDRRDGAAIAYSGRYLEIVPARRIVFTLALDEWLPSVTRVEVDVGAAGGGCALTLTHGNVPRRFAQYLKGRWTGALYGLGQMLDTASAGFPTTRSPR